MGRHRLNIYRYLYGNNNEADISVLIFSAVSALQYMHI